MALSSPVDLARASGMMVLVSRSLQITRLPRRLLSS